MTVREQWRQAAMMDRRQVMFLPDGTIDYRGTGRPLPECAISLIRDWSHLMDGGVRDQGHRCPVDGCAMMIGRLPSSLAVHLNNVHRWDWLTLATKFPPILPEDQP